MSKYQADHLPVAIEAEEALLGCLLLDSETINRIASITQTEHFSLISHQTIFKSIWNLYQKKVVVDLMSVTNHLVSSKNLDQIGGTTKLSQLINRTVSSTNADRYALLILDKYKRRKLIELGHILSNLGSHEELDLKELKTLVKANTEEWLEKNSQISNITQPIEVNYQRSIISEKQSTVETNKANDSKQTISESVTLKTVTNSVSRITELVTELKQKAKDSLEEQK